MRILIVNNAIIPVRLYGGTERVIWGLGKALVALGHEVTYLVKKGSHCDFAKVIPIDDNQSIIAQITDDYDVVHFNFRPPNLEAFHLPYLITMHGNSNNFNEFDQNTVFVSSNHAERYGAKAFVHNGLDWGDYSQPNFQLTRDYFHFLGKAAWRVKNVKGAIEVIKGTKREKLKVLGGVRFNFKMGIRFTFSPRIGFEGMVGGDRKFKLLNHSKGLIFPVRWHEPFGLAIVESMFYGCPVFGTPYGSLPELVTKETGFLSNKSSELTAAIEQVGQLNAKHCHEYALEKFNNHVMAAAYLEKYEEVINDRPLNDKPPKLIQLQEQKFLDWE